MDGLWNDGRTGLTSRADARMECSRLRAIVLRAGIWFAQHSGLLLLWHQHSNTVFQTTETVGRRRMQLSAHRAAAAASEGLSVWAASEDQRVGGQE